MKRRPPTKAEATRITRMLRLGCICCLLQFGVESPAECHHMTDGGRLGHLYTLPLCAGHHRGVWTGWEELGADLIAPPVSIVDGRDKFDEAYGTEMELWIIVQGKLELPTTPPTTKILPRQIA